MKLNLSKVKKKGEDEHFYHLHDGKSDFKVAKAGLSKSTHDQIQHFFLGGDVLDTVNPALEGQTLPGAGAAPEATIQTPNEREADIQSTMDKVMGQAPANAFDATPPAAPAPAPAPQAQAKPAKAGGGAPAPDADQKDLADANLQAQTAEQSKADIATAAAQEQANIEADHQIKKQAAVQILNDRIADADKQANQIDNDIASTKIDPNHYWHSKTTGQKVGSIIGLILGGLGGGLNRTNQNLALQMLNKAVEDDVHAQEVDLGKKQSRLRYWMDQGHTLREAKQLTIAEANDALAGALKMSASKYAAPQAQAIAQENIATLKQNGVANRMKVRDDALARTFKGLEIQKAQADLNASQAAAKNAPLQQALMDALATGHAVSGAYESVLPPDRTITTAEGIRLAKTPKDAEEVKKIQKAASDLSNIIAEVKAFRERNPYGTGPKTAEAHRGDFLQKRFIQSAGHLQELARLTEPEIDLDLGQFMNPGGTFLSGTTSGKVNAQMDELQNMVNSKLNSVYAPHLMGGAGVSAGVTPTKVKK